jgi:hypothetical protein
MSMDPCEWRSRIRCYNSFIWYTSKTNNLYLLSLLANFGKKNRGSGSVQKRYHTVHTWSFGSGSAKPSNERSCQRKQYQSVNCFSHTLQLAVQKTLREKAKALSGKFSKSVKAKEKLHECGGLALKTYCRTRWFSELHLVDSLLANHERPGDPVGQMLAYVKCEELVPTALVSKKNG